MNEIVTYIVIGGIFLAGMVPVIAGIVFYTKRNRALNKREDNFKSKTLIQHF